MHSILIQNQSTMESFHDYHAFFMEAILENRISVCRWIESGDTIENALPELRELTADKEKWRAIIVRVTDESEMSQFKADESNPYDFDLNKDKEVEYGKSPIPLIRLTHILGGVPAPRVEFQDKTIYNEYGAPEVVFKPVENKEKQKAYKELDDLYRYDGKRPDEIVIVTFHKRAHIKDNTKVEFAWSNYLEMESSEFWLRNNYPANCRFVKYDFEEQGPICKNADLYNFWMSVLLMSINDINPSALQGYRLYSIKTEFDYPKMAAAFQEKTDLLVGTKSYIGAEIKRGLEKRASIDETSVMDFSVNEGLEVMVDNVRSDNLSVATSEFGLCGKTSNDDFNKWEGMRGIVETNLDNMYKRADRELEKGTDMMRLRQHLEDEDVKPINHFQEEDIIETLDGLYIQILNEQSEMEGLTRKNQERITDKANVVREEMVHRITSSTAFTVALGIALTVLLTCVPSIFIRRVKILPTIIPSLLIVLLILVVFAFVELIILLVCRFDLTDKIDAYNDEVEKAHEDLEKSAKGLTDFVRNVVSYSRGSDYLNILEYKKCKTGYAYDALTRHLKATNMFLDKLRKWSKAFYFNTDFEPLAQDNFRIDIELTPQKNYLYTFESGKDYSIPLNESGDEIISPFGFVKRFNIDREELFNDTAIDKTDDVAAVNNDSDDSSSGTI